MTPIVPLTPRQLWYYRAGVVIAYASVTLSGVMVAAAALYLVWIFWSLYA